MKKYVTLHKEVGQTPLQAVETWRAKSNIAQDVPLAYAGRLDPMASGALLVLIGDECKRQGEYHGLDKRYVFDVLLGFESDTHDLLGLATKTKTTKRADNEMLAHCAAILRGKQSLPYPAFSSKTVDGKPLFLWTLEGKIDDIEIPKKKSTIHKMKHEGLREIAAADLLAHIREKIALIAPVTEESKKLGKDFRRVDILARWAELLEGRRDTYQIARFSCIASSGTYMRSLSEAIGNKLHTGGLAFSIDRTHIGKYYPLTRSRGVWYKRF